MSWEFLLLGSQNLLMEVLKEWQWTSATDGQKCLSNLDFSSHKAVSGQFIFSSAKTTECHASCLMVMVVLCRVLACPTPRAQTRSHCELPDPCIIPHVQIQPEEIQCTHSGEREKEREISIYLLSLASCSALGTTELSLKRRAESEALSSSSYHSPCSWCH